MSTEPELSVQDLGRVRSIARSLARHGFGHVLKVDDDGDATPSDDPGAPFARRLRRLLTDLGPTFVKLGQVLSLRPDIVPPAVGAELQKLQHEVPPMSAADTLAVIEGELGRPWGEVFAEIDMKPLGSASIAQVHRARLLSGEEVAIKVQRAGIEPVIRSDLHILDTIARLVEGRVVIPGLYTPAAIVREFDAAIQRELDFVGEAQNARRIAEVLRGTDVVVPAVYPALSSRRLLVMQRVEGAPMSEVYPTLSEETRKAVAHQLMDATWRQVFEHGFFHGDPHPGNLFVTPDGRLALLDFGICGILTASMQDTILQTFTAMVFRDPDALALTIYRAGATRERVELRELRAALELKMLEYYGASLDDLAQRDTLMEVVEMATRFHIDLPPAFAVLSRALTLIEANVRRLLPGADIVAEVRPYADRLIQRRFEPQRLVHDLGSAALRFQVQARDLPTQLSQTLLDLDAGRLQLVARDPDADAMRHTVHASVRELSLAVVGVGGVAICVLHLDLGVRALTPDLLALTLGVLGLAALGALCWRWVVPPGWRAVSIRRTVWRLWRFFRRPTDHGGPPSRAG